MTSRNPVVQSSRRGSRIGLRHVPWALLVALGCGGQMPTPEKAPAQAPVETPAAAAPAPAYAYPETRRQDIVDTLHGVAVADPYRWLEDGESDEVKAWADAQDALARSVLDARPERAGYAETLRKLHYVDSVGAPTERGGKLFYARRHADKEKAIVYWRPVKSDESAEKVLFDPNTLSEDGSIALGRYEVSPDGKKVVYQLKANNADEATLYVKNVEDGAQSEIDRIDGAKYASPSWTPDSKGFYYTYIPPKEAVDEAQRPGHQEVRFHALGTAADADLRIFPATGSPRTFVGSEISEDGKWLVVSIYHGWNRTEVYVKPAKRGRVTAAKAMTEVGEVDSSTPTAWVTPFREKAKAAGFTPMVEDVNALFEVKWHKNAFFVLTNHEAPRFRVMRTTARKLAITDWQEVVPQTDDTLQGASVAGDQLALSYLRRAASHLEISSLDGKKRTAVTLPTVGTASISTNSKSKTAYVQVKSFTTPNEVYALDIKTGGVTPWARTELPIDTSELEVTQVTYKSKDGTAVPMFVMHKKGLPHDNKAPTLLYGYGGFNVAITPWFSALFATWASEGGVVAVANLRGGSEFGEDWHQDGMLLKKQNVFDDFIAAGEFLVASGYTSPKHLAVYGGSNGGLLVGTVMSQRPDLYQAVVCAVPLLDMVRYHMFGSGQTWVPEYGSADDAAQFEVLHGYSPYHHLEEGTDYPALLMLAADSDDRVDPLHARKFTAAVQHASSGERPRVMRVERNAGHGGGDLAAQRVEKDADVLAFLNWQLRAASTSKETVEAGVEPAQPSTVPSAE